jgi:hypothetical protein
MKAILDIALHWRYAVTLNPRSDHVCEGPSVQVDAEAL